MKHLLATGDIARFAVDSFGSGGQFFEDREKLIQWLESNLTEDSVVLVKGSRSMRMEQIVNALTGQHDLRGEH